MIKDPEVEQAILKDLANAVCNQAVKDLKKGQIEYQLDAALWLTGDDLPVWLAAALDDDPDNLKCAGINALTSGRINEFIKRGKKT